MLIYDGCLQKKKRKRQEQPDRAAGQAEEEAEPQLRLSDDLLMLVLWFSVVVNVKLIMSNSSHLLMMRV